MEKQEQLSAFAEKCNEFSAQVRHLSNHLSVTVSIPPPWNAKAEIDALKVQKKIKEWSKLYPDVMVYYFDSFSTLLYVV